jgi:hypothetical protein
LALQRKLAGRWANLLVGVKADSEVNEESLKDSHILLVGRPATNRVAARLAKSLPVQFGPTSCRVAGQTYAHPHTFVVAAGPSPLASNRSVVIVAGLSAESTWTAARRLPESGPLAAEVVLCEGGGTTMRRLAVEHGGDQAGIAAATR